nr:MAG TPA: Cytosine specific methyltransferase [Caudoviricetes sp.]
MVKPLTLGSLFDGIGGFCLAGQYAGMKPIWASEIEPFPMRVTEKRFSDVRQLGDVNSLSGEDIPPVDVITFGSPCQNLSIAGKRAGLQGTQSSLFFQAIRIITEMRCKTHGQYPSYAVWENVPGALSSNDGQDFRQVLESLAQIADEHTAVPMPENGKWLGAGEILGDHYSLAWRILDASKGWGVAQRRRRIFLVADFAGTGAGEILFESEGLSGYTPPCGEAWQGTARGAEGGTGASGTVVLNDQGGNRMDITENETSTLRAKMNSHQPVILASGFCTEHSADSRGIGYVEEESPTLRAGVTPGVAIEFNPTDNRIKVKENGICQTLCSRMGTGGNNVPLTLKIRSGCEGGGKGSLVQENQSATLSTRNDQTLFQPKVYGISSDQSHAMLSDNPHSGIYEADTSRTLDCKGGNPSCNQGGIAVVEAYALQGSMIGRKDENGPQGDGINKDVSFTLNTIDRHAVYAMNVGFFAA